MCQGVSYKRLKTIKMYVSFTTYILVGVFTNKLISSATIPIFVDLYVDFFTLFFKTPVLFNRKKS